MSTFTFNGRSANKIQRLYYCLIVKEYLQDIRVTNSCFLSCVVTNIMKNCICGIDFLYNILHFVFTVYKFSTSKQFLIVCAFKKMMKLVLFYVAQVCKKWEAIMNLTYFILIIIISPWYNCRITWEAISAMCYYRINCLYFNFCYFAKCLQGDL